MNSGDVIFGACSKNRRNFFLKWEYVHRAFNTLDVEPTACSNRPSINDAHTMNLFLVSKNILCIYQTAVYNVNKYYYNAKHCAKFTNVLREKSWPSPNWIPKLLQSRFTRPLLQNKNTETKINCPMFLLMNQAVFKKVCLIITHVPFWRHCHYFRSMKNRVKIFTSANYKIIHFVHNFHWVFSSTIIA